jgi:hypothetical protein
MSLLIRVLFALIIMPATALAAEVTGSVTEVTGDTVVIAADAPVGAGDPVVIYFEIPGLNELTKVGSGRVVGAESGRIVAHIEQYTGKLAIGQIAKIQASGTALLPPPESSRGNNLPVIPRPEEPVQPRSLPPPPPLGPWRPSNR